MNRWPNHLSWTSLALPPFPDWTLYPVFILWFPWKKHTSTTIQELRNGSSRPSVAASTLLQRSSTLWTRPNPIGRSWRAKPQLFVRCSNCSTANSVTELWEWYSIGLRAPVHDVSRSRTLLCTRQCSKVSLLVPRWHSFSPLANNKLSFIYSSN